MTKALHLACSILFASAVCVLAMREGNASTVFDNGLVNDFSGTSLGNNPIYDSTSGNTTTLNVLDGATFGNISAFDSSRVNVFPGATINGKLLGTDSAVVTVYGGSTAAIDAGGSSTLSFVDGYVNASVRGFGNATIAITDGLFESNGSSPNAVSLLGDSTLVLRGGVFDGRLFFAGNFANVYGGSFTSLVNQGGSITTIYGSNFNLPYGEITGNLLPTALTGTLADGTALNAIISQGDGFTSRIILSPVPEPSTFAMFVSGLVVLGSLAGVRKVL